MTFLPVRRLVLCLLLTGWTIPAQQPAAAYTSDPAFVKLRAEAIRLGRSRADLLFAADAWMKANALAGGRCIECFQGAIEAQFKAGEPRKAAEIARQWDRVAATQAEHSIAEIQLARALLLAGGEKKPNVAMMEEAHAALVKAEEAAPAAYFYDGRVLAFLKRDSEAAEAFRRYAASARDTDPLGLRARHFSLHPELAREQMVPAMMVSTLSGKRFNLDDLNGKVVLIDFWATWCGPCKQELPHLKKIAEKFAGEPFEMISVSWDDDEAAWKNFIAEKGMSWHQYRDTQHTLSRAFGVNAIPHYFTIDANGVLMAENIGSGSDIEGRIRKLIRQAKEDREKLAGTAVAATQ